MSGTEKLPAAVAPGPADSLSPTGEEYATNSR